MPSALRPTDLVPRWCGGWQQGELAGGLPIPPSALTPARGRAFLPRPNLSAWKGSGTRPARRGRRPVRAVVLFGVVLDLSNIDAISHRSDPGTMY